MRPDLRRQARRAGRASQGWRVAAGATAALLCGGVAAQGLTITPTLALTETRTNNRDLSSGGRQSDFITQISPGISINAGRGPLKGALNYSLSGLYYADKPSLNNVYHTLSSLAGLSLLDGRAGVDATASAGRQVISAFGTQSTDPALNNANAAQVFSYSLAPYLRGVLLGDVSYQTRLVYAGSRSDASSAGDTSSIVGTAGLSGRLGALGWAVDGNRAIYENGDRPKGHNGGINSTWTYSPDIEVQLQARAGFEVDDMRTGVSERTTIWGAGVTWRPGPRTNLRAEYDRRFFGNSHLLSFSHRMASTVWTFSDSRSLQTGGTTGRSVVSLFDQLFALSPEPDLAKRAVDVRDFIARNNLNPNEQVTVGGFLTGSPSVQRSQVASVAYQGLRMTVALSFVQTTSSRVSTSLAAGDDLANGAQPRQKGLSLSVSHRLTPDSSLVVSAATQRTAATATLPANELRTLSTTWSATLGPRTDVSLGARYSSFDSDTNPYQESAVFGSLRLRF